MAQKQKIKEKQKTKTD